jgi:hypothetical protein
MRGWDSAKTTGQDTRLDPDLVQVCLPDPERVATQFRSAGVSGGDVSVSVDADPHTKLFVLACRGT